jgi:ABC-type multidrug transport system ATPase subunit
MPAETGGLAASGANLEATDVSRTIDDEVLLAPTSLTVTPGSCLAVQGQNGAGKTTLLRILAGKQRPSSGSVTFAGRVVDERDARIRRDVASLIGVPAFYPDLTMREQLLLINATWGVSRSDSPTMADAALERFGISHLHGRFVHELSSGQTQLFYLTATFSRPCTMLILDEPDQRLDPDRKESLVRAVLEAKASGTTIILTSHDASLVERLADDTIELGTA